MEGLKLELHILWKESEMRSTQSHELAERRMDANLQYARILSELKIAGIYLDLTRFPREVDIISGRGKE